MIINNTPTSCYDNHTPAFATGQLKPIPGYTPRFCTGGLMGTLYNVTLYISEKTNEKGLILLLSVENNSK
jgi:hypothetical protein